MESLVQATVEAAKKAGVWGPAALKKNIDSSRNIKSNCGVSLAAHFEA